MIVMIISEQGEKERKYLVYSAKNFAGLLTEEPWDIVPCKTQEELSEVITRRDHVDLVCIDITVEGALKLAAELRRRMPGVYMILIASARISPMKYMRPTIAAESLMLKPLSNAQIEEVMGEAVRAFLERFYEPDEKEFFVLEQGGERTLIEYDRIFFFEAREKRIYLNTDVDEYGFYETIDHLMESLPDTFVRCHRSYLVNKNKIVSVYLSQNRILLEEDFEIPLSRSYKAAIKELSGSR